MRPIDADALKKDLKELEFRCRKMLWSGSELYVEALAVVKNMIDSVPTITQPPNDPLTMEELRGMDGEPVWCVDGRGNQCWCLVNCDDGFPCCYDNETGLWEDCYYGMRGDDEFGLHKFGWLAYRRKPEEGTT